MIRLKYYQVCAFAEEIFQGNPAGVVVLETALEPGLKQKIAAETGMPATAFLRRDGPHWTIRWFTPTMELPLCGHGTLAASWVIFEKVVPGAHEVPLLSPRSGGIAARKESGLVWLDFPAHPARATSNSDALLRKLEIDKGEVLETDGNLMVVLPEAHLVVDYSPNMAAISELDHSGLILTARGLGEFDCVSRYFAPRKGVGEDAVTGSAHCTVAPFWSERLGKGRIRARQASERGGTLTCEVQGDQVRLAGSCRLFFEGELHVE